MLTICDVYILSFCVTATTKFLLSGFATAAGEYIKYKIQGNFSENTGQYVSDIVFSLVWHKITERFLGPFKEGCKFRTAIMTKLFCSLFYYFILVDLSVAAAVDCKFRITILLHHQITFKQCS